MELYDRIVDPELLVRRVNITANKIVPAGSYAEKENSEQLSMFTDYEEELKKREAETAELEEEEMYERLTPKEKAAFEEKRQYFWKKVFGNEQ